MATRKFQLVLQFLGDSIADFDELIAFEDQLSEQFRGSLHFVDGHDFGSGTMNLFIHTDEPEAALRLAKRAMNKAQISRLKAAYRSFEADDYVWLFPADSSDEFRLL